MADGAKADAAAKDPRPSQSSPGDAPKERRYSVDEAADMAARFEVSPHAIRGALSGVDRETHTAEQVVKAVNDWLKKPIEQPPDPDETVPA